MPNEIKIGKKYKITTDRYNVIISGKKKNRKTGEIYWKAKWFYPTFETALIGFIDHELKATELEFIVDRIETLKKEVLNAVNLTVLRPSARV